MTEDASSEEPIETVRNAAGVILGVSENRSWIEVFFEGDLMHTKTVNPAEGRVFDVYVEEVPHKATVYEPPRTMILFRGPCDIEILREGDKIIVRGVPREANESLA
ncbi:MAG TPA: hypothetical protein VIB79_17440 [Candidatus Binatia bacterium]|jgi:hypothetical protein